MADQRLKELLDRYIALEATEAENEELKRLMAEAWDSFDPKNPPFGPDVTRQMLENVRRRIAPKIERRWPRIAAAAAIIFCCSAAVYLYRHGNHQPATHDIVQSDIKPGTNGAILTLANGRKIILESAKNGQLAQQGGSQVNKADDSLLVYQPTTATAANATPVLAYNTLETPKGRQVEVVLPDGTEVWLNAASSLKYPTAFTGKERLVELTGEADFKVTPNKKMPFRVKTNGQLTEDIGTEFNIDAYADESDESTTLLEGAIKVNGARLKPGQQAVLTGDRLSLTTANVAEVMAWKNGDFIFDNADIQTVMRQLARWYDIEATYEGQLTANRFNAQISRKQNISVILNALQRTNDVHFKIEGRKVTVIQ